MHIEPQMNFDTHESIKFLIGKGFKETQAESIVKIVSQSRDYDFAKLATRDQLKIIEEKIKSLDAKIDAVDERLGAKIDAVEERLAGKITAENAVTREAIISSKFDMLKWILPFLIGIILTIVFKH